MCYFTSRQVVGAAWVFGLVASRICNASLPLIGTQQIAAGNFTTCAVVSGSAQCWGANILGLTVFNGAPYGYFYFSGTPVKVPLPGAAVSQVAVGGQHICSLSNGAVTCWGDRSYGQTGPNGMPDPSPVLVTGANSGVTSISAGGLNTCAIANGGAICWGDNFFGQLGNNAVPSGEYGDYSAAPVSVVGLESGVQKIAVGTTALPQEDESGHVCAIVAGVAKCWGKNAQGELGRDTLPAHSATAAAGDVSGLGAGVTDIATGEAHSCAVVNGAAYCWGSNYYAQLGSNSVPVGYPNYSQTPVLVQGLGSGVVAISAAAYHTCALVNNDTAHPIKCWGNNGWGELGNGTAASGTTPVNVTFFPALTAANQVTTIIAGGQHTCAAIATSGVSKTYCWGDNEAGELGVSDALVENPAPQSVVGLSSNISSLATGSDNWHGCAVVSGAARCWGEDISGQLGDGLFIDRSVALGITGLESGVTQIAAGGSFNCAIVSGAAKCWGGGSSGVLGNNSQATQTSPTQVTGLAANVDKIAASGGQVLISATGESISIGGHACAVISGAIQCWGENIFGELGNASIAVGYGSYSAVPVAVTGISGATNVVVTGGTTCAIVNNGVQCWGQRVGNLAFPSGSPTPVAVTGLASGVTALAAGHTHLCALQNGNVKCWGDNSQGQFGDGNSSPSVEPMATSGVSNITAIAAGGYHTCAVQNGGVQCWGLNLSGELGTGTTGGFRVLPVAVTTLTTGVVALAAGTSHTCALLGSSAIKCWGSDFNGQLGDGRILSAETPQLVVRGETIFKSGFEY